MKNAPAIKGFVTPLTADGKPVTGGLMLPVAENSFRGIRKIIAEHGNPSANWGFSESNSQNGTWQTLPIVPKN